MTTTWEYYTVLWFSSDESRMPMNLFHYSYLQARGPDEAKKILMGTHAYKSDEYVNVEVVGVIRGKQEIY